VQIFPKQELETNIEDNESLMKIDHAGIGPVYTVLFARGRDFSLRRALEPA